MELTQDQIAALSDCAEKLPALLKRVEILLARKSPEQTEWITKAEAKELLKGSSGKPCSDRTLCRLVDTGYVTTNGNRRKGRQVRYSASMINKYISNIDRKHELN